MSHESVVAFFEQLKSDEALKGQVDAAGKTAEEYAASLVTLGAAHGHTFTAEECVSVLQAVHEYHAKESQELGDDELEKAAGGLASVSPVGKAVMPSGSLTSLTSLMDTGLLGSSTLFKPR